MRLSEFVSSLASIVLYALVAGNKRVGPCEFDVNARIYLSKSKRERESLCEDANETDVDGEQQVSDATLATTSLAQRVNPFIIIIIYHATKSRPNTALAHTTALHCSNKLPVALLLCQWRATLISLTRKRTEETLTQFLGHRSFARPFFLLLFIHLKPTRIHSTPLRGERSTLTSAFHRRAQALKLILSLRLRQFYARAQAQYKTQTSGSEFNRIEWARL